MSVAGQHPSWSEAPVLAPSEYVLGQIMRGPASTMLWLHAGSFSVARLTKVCLCKLVLLFSRVSGSCTSTLVHLQPGLRSHTQQCCGAAQAINDPCSKCSCCCCLNSLCSLCLLARKHARTWFRSTCCCGVRVCVHSSTACCATRPLL